MSSLDNVRQCSMCRKPFISLGSKLCGNCLERIELDFVTIRDYLYNQSGSISIKELAKETEVPEKSILHLLREGRIELMVSGADGLVCEMCGRTIASGQFCVNCKDILAKSLGSEPKPAEENKAPKESKEPPERGRMHGSKR